MQGYGKADGDDAMGNVFHQATECLKEIHLRLGNPLRRHLRFLPVGGCADDGGGCACVRAWLLWVGGLPEGGWVGGCGAGWEF